MGDVATLATLLVKAAAYDRKEEMKQYHGNGTAAQIEMSIFAGNPERQALWLLDHVCKSCGLHGVARLELIWCKTCADQKENTKNG